MFQKIPTHVSVFTLSLFLGLISSLGNLSGEDKGNDVNKDIADLKKRLSQLENQVSTNKKESKLDQWARGLEKNENGNVFERGNMRLVDVSLDLISSVGASSKKSDALRNLQAGGHDPKRRGFTLQQAELALTGAVDPYFTGEIYFITSLDDEGETQLELEEAFLTTTSLPHGLELEFGHFFTEFGRLNPTHPHAWQWQDQPIINTRLFGGDGMRGVGAKVSWLVPLPWQSDLHYSIQNAKGENMVSFFANDEVYEERAIGGRTFVDQDTNDLRDFAHLIRWEHGFDINSELSAKLGASHLFGPNATGRKADTKINGIDLVMKWTPEKNNKGWPFVLFEGEYMQREFDVVLDETSVLPSETLYDDGWYAQLIYGFKKNWALGVRFEKARGSAKGSLSGRQDDPYRDQRERFSPMIAWHLSEYSRLRLQYNYDRAEHLSPDHDAHSVWLGFEISLGAHPAHKY